ncbi:hypothetical protein ABD76_09005 [Paenibacillus dendritiformis]|nr:hypothetical protein [Paenibacillus dendritiformis]
MRLILAKAPFLYFTTYAEQSRIMKYEGADGKGERRNTEARPRDGEGPVAGWLDKGRFLTLGDVEACKEASPPGERVASEAALLPWIPPVRTRS